MELRIAHTQADFQKATQEADLAHRAKLAAKVKYNTKTTAIPKVLIKDLICGIRVSMFFKWGELDDFEKPHAKCAAKHAGSDGEGEWRTGTVEKMKQNKYRKWAYYTVFDTPSRFAEWFDAGTTKDARINYLELEAIREAQVTSDDDGLSSPDVNSERPKGRDKTSVPPPTKKDPHGMVSAMSVFVPETQECVVTNKTQEEERTQRQAEERPMHHEEEAAKQQEVERHKAPEHDAKTKHEEPSKIQEEEERLTQQKCDADNQPEEQRLKQQEPEVGKQQEEETKKEQAEERRKEQELEAEKQLEETRNKQQEEEMLQPKKCVADTHQEEERLKQPEHEV